MASFIRFIKKRLKNSQINEGFISNKELQTAILKQSFGAMDNDKNGLFESNEFKGSKVHYL